MKTAFLFSGQGAQCPGMMKDIAQTSEKANAIFDAANRTLDRDIRFLCFEGTQEDLNLTHNTQPCVLAADLAAYAAISEYGIKPDAVAGFSLGEYAALVSTGVIDLCDAFSVIQKRADYMQAAVPLGQGAMAAVMKLSELEVQKLCDEIDGYIVLANFNCPGQIVVSGESDAVDRLLDVAKEKKIRAIKLAVSAPFHCEMMNPAAERLKGPLASISFSTPSVPVYLNVDAEAETQPEKIKEKLIMQAKSPVCWEKTLRNMYEDGINTFIELGPGKTLSGFVRKTFANREDVRIFSIMDVETLKSTIATIREE